MWREVALHSRPDRAGGAGAVLRAQKRSCCCDTKKNTQTKYLRQYHLTKVGMIATTTPAFDGANFDTGGGCLRHPEIKLTQKTVVDGGKTVVYRELMSRCPKCTPGPGGAPGAPRHHRKSSSSSSYTTKAQTSTNNDANAFAPRDSPGCGGSPGGRHAGGSRQQQPSSSSSSSSSSAASNNNSPGSRASNKSYVSRHSSGLSSSSRVRSKSPAAPSVRGDDDDESRSQTGQQQQQHRRRSKSPARARSRSATIKPRKVYDTPFDAKGRCHHHPNLQLAKKKLTGGWKVRRVAWRSLFLSLPLSFIFLWGTAICLRNSSPTAK